MQVCRGGDEISFTNMGLVAEMVLAQVCVRLVSSFVGRFRRNIMPLILKGQSDKALNIYKYRQNTIKLIILYHFWITCFDTLESSSGPLVN